MLSNLKTKLARFLGQENLEFLKHSGNYLSGTLIRNVLVAASIPILTQLLTPAEYGILSIFTSIVAMLTIVAMLNVHSGIVRYYLEKTPDFDRALGTNLLFLVAFNLAFLGAMVFFAGPLARLCAIDREVFLFAAAVSFFSVMVETYLAYMNASRQSRKHAAITVLRTAVSLAVSIVLILLLSEERYLGRIYGELIMMVLVSGYSLYSLSKLATLSFDTKYIKYTLRYSVPLIPHMLSKYILGYFDRIIIKQLTTDTATGLYSFAYDVGSAMNLIVMATVKAWRPIFFDEYREQNIEKIDRMVYDYANYIYIAAIGIILFATDLVTLLAEAQYYEALPLVPPIVLGYVFVFLYTLFFQYAAYQKRTELISLNTFIAGAANIQLNYWLIPVYGYAAAAYTTLGSFALLFVLHYINARFVLKQRVIKLSKISPNFALVAGVAALYMYLAEVITSYALFFVVRVGIMALTAVYFWLCKKRAVRAPRDRG